MRSQHADQLVLQVVGILILIDHDIPEPLRIISEYFRLLLKQFYSVPQEIVEVHRIVSHQLFLIPAVDLIYHLILRQALAGRQILFRTFFVLLALADHCYEESHRSDLLINSQVLAYPLNKSLLVSLIINSETRPVAQRFA